MTSAPACRLTSGCASAGSTICAPRSASKPRPAIANAYLRRYYAQADADEAASGT
jgi:hypothetical protein